MHAHRYDAVLFDLDGTLADTAGDLGFALNVQRSARGLSPLSEEQVRPHASAGARGLLQLGFGLGPDHPDYEAMRSEFLDLYAETLSRSTDLFPGIDEVLDVLEDRGLRWGIVTNKPQRFTRTVLEALKLSARAACVVCGDMVQHPKPHPASLIAAARLLDLPTEACLYVGDDERDIAAARAAGMDSVVALYGYLGQQGGPETWGATASIASPLHLLDLPGLGRHLV
ncbi:MAG TPA: HAD-IA family hydrolase [Burkholderiales bacterium]|nr:HAD-IA family hydrolase [Burkholderiales bacterium]